MSKVHAKLSPSSAERWFNCPGSINLINTLPETALKPNKYGAEGTVAHQLAEDHVRGALDLLTLSSKVGETVMQDGFEIEITDAMVEGVIEYVEHIASVRKRLHKPAPVVGEAEVRVIASSVDEDVYGTADYILYQKGNELHVFDFKFGKGVVEAEDNKQGLIYLVGAADTIGTDVFDRVFFHIVQPRARHNEGSARPWMLPANRLHEFRAELKAAVDRTKAPTALREAGSWCKFCPALAYCPEAKGGVERAVSTVFTKIPAPPSKEAGQLSLPSVTTLTPENVAKALDWEDTIDSWFEALRERALTDMTAGLSVPGYKLVEGKANRVWSSEAEVETAFAMLGDERYNRKLKSPAQMEKIAGKDEVAKYTFKPAGKLTVAKDSDKREAANVTTAKPQDVFGQISVAEMDVLKMQAENNRGIPLMGAQDMTLFGDLMGAPSEKKGPIWP